MNGTHNHHGFTLIEVVLSLAVAAGVAMTVFSTFQLIQTIHTRQQAVGVVAWESELSIHRIRALIAKGVVAPAPQESGQTLIVEGGDMLSLRDGVLVLARGGSEVALSSSAVHVSSLSFEHLGTVESPGIVRVRYVVASLASASAESFELPVATSMYE